MQKIIFEGTFYCMSFANYNPSAFIRAHKMPVQESEVLWQKNNSLKKA